MMDHNSVYLSGSCERAGVKEGKFGPQAWLQMTLQTIQSNLVTIPAHKIFVGVNLGSDKPEKVVRNRELFKKVEAGGFITLWDCTIDSYVKRDETQVNRRLKGSISKMMIARDTGMPINLAAFVGKVIQTPAEDWVELQCSHRPGPHAKPGEAWPTRSIKVHIPGGKIKMKIGHQYLVAGKVSGRTPGGKEDLIVVATVVNGV